MDGGVCSMKKIILFLTLFLFLSGGVAEAITFGNVSTKNDEAYDSTNWDGSIEVATKNALRDKFEAGGSDTNAEKVYNWGGCQLWTNEANFAPCEDEEGTNTKTKVDAYDYTTTEYRNGVLYVPNDVDSSGTVTFEIAWQARTAPASAENVLWEIDTCAVDNEEDYDCASWTTDTATADSATTAQDNLIHTEWTETITNLGWTAEDTVYFRFSRDSADANDTLDTRTDTNDDAQAHRYTIRIPRA